MESINAHLRIAAEKGDVAKLQALLLDPKCDALSKDTQGRTALMRASDRGYFTCVQLLLPSSAPLTKDHAGRTALMYSANHGHLTCVQLLLPVSNSETIDNSGHQASYYARHGNHLLVADTIDSYTYAISERNAIDSSTSSKDACKKPLLRL